MNVPWDGASAGAHAGGPVGGTGDGASDDSALDLLRALIGIDSVNPALVPGGAGESRIATAAADWLTERGLSCRRLEATPGRPSIVATSAGTGGGRSLMLNGHLDTVSLASYVGDGLHGEIRDGAVFGRGAYDMKSGLAAMMVAAERAHRAEHRGDIVLALVADEEHASIGTEEVLRQVVTDGAIVVEPTGLDIVTAHRGFVWATVTVHGRAAHGSRPDLGIDAIARAGRLLTAIEDLDVRLASGPPHPLLGTGNVHAGTITGGAETSSFPADCVLTVERRTLPGEDDATFAAELDGIIREIRRVGTDLDVAVEITTHRAPFQATVGSPVEAALATGFQAVTGRQPRRRGEPFWTDCALLADAGIDTAMFGVDGGGAHAASEWVTLDSLRIATDTLEHAILDYTG